MCMARMISPEVQTQVAEYFGEAPANPRLPVLDPGYGPYQLPGLLRRVRRQRPDFYDSISFWKTPQAALRRRAR